MKKYILALDQGTTSSRAILFNRDAIPVSKVQKEITQYYPYPGWVEHDPSEIWYSQTSAAGEVIMKAGINREEIAAIGIANQRETTIVWDRRTGRAVYNAIVWQDRRTSPMCDLLKEEGMSCIITDKTGLVIDPYFSATKVRWILDNVGGARRLAERGRLAFGTVDTWLVWNLTGGRLHITDVSNASRTMLFNIHTLKWDEELLEIFNIPYGILPEIRYSSEEYGTSEDKYIGQVPVSGIAGDQQAALFGQLCVDQGMVKSTYGTGCFVVMNTGNKPVRSGNRLLTTIAWQIKGETQYALEGSIFNAGAVIQWLRDSIGIICDAGEVEKLASQVVGSEGVYFIPAFTGMGAPHWNDHARGTLFGLTRGSESAHIAAAALESIAYQTLEVLIAMQDDSGIEISELRVDGGASVNNRLMQFQADILHKRVIRPGVTETTAIGAAFLAGLAVNYWNDTTELRKLWHREKLFTPQMKREDTDLLVKGWNRAVRALKRWADDRDGP